MDKNKIDFVDKVLKESWTYIKTVVDIVHEPIVILDKSLKVLAANEPFYQTFQVKSADTVGKVVYDLGNGQWDIPALRKLLEDILPKNTFFKGFEVDHDFPSIGRKIMILNARQIYTKEDVLSEKFPPIILLAIEDITEMVSVTKQLSSYITNFEADIVERIKKIKSQLKHGSV